MPSVKEIEAFLFSWAPRAAAADWDNVGHLVGDPEQEVKRVLVALDITESVADEAAEQDAQLIVSHHPVMNCAWAPVQSVRADMRQGRILTTLIERHISAICMHTNLDAAEGGVNDVLAAALGLRQTVLLNEEKFGRVGTLKSEIPLVEFLPSVVKSLQCRGLRYTDSGRPVYKAAVGGGACGAYIADALALGCDTFVTSDLKYHDFLDYGRAINLIDAGHFPTENLICPVIAQRLRSAFPDLTVSLSERHDREPIQYFTKEN